MSAAENKQEVAVPRYDQVIDKVESDFSALAPSSMRFAAERGFALQHLQNNEYLMKVAESNPISLAQAMKNVAAIVLSLNPAKKQAYLIPRSVKIGMDYINKIFLEPSYMGMCDLATSSGAIVWIQARVVHANDQFEDNGPGEKPTHKYDAFASLEKRGEFVGAYCVAKTKDGDYLTTTMNAEAIYKIRDKSEQYKRSKSGPWVDHFEEQAKKTVVRNAFKMWPKGEHMERLEQAVQLSNDNEGFEPFVTAPNLNSYTVEQKKFFDQLISQSDHIELFLFMRSLDWGVKDSLFNSFEKGTITRYKQIVRELEAKGAATLNDCVAEINSNAEAGDDSGIKEIIEGLSKDAIQYLKDYCAPEAAAMIRELEDVA